jgi:glycosyltransferase involved in cell wall biosynthesis
MTALAYFILLFTAVQLIVALVNLFTETHLPHTGRMADRKVSVLVPARNEEKNIADLLTDIKLQPYRNIEVIVFDDQSEDMTSAIVNQYVEEDPRFSLISSGSLPGGWLGKNHACHTLASAATGDYLLFLDADVRVSGNLISDSVIFSEKSKTDLVSIFPMQRIISRGEWATVPNMNYILVSLLPLFLVRHSRFPSLAAANGQFMFFRADAYRNLMPHEKMKENKVEDILIARYFKKKGLTVSCLLGDERISCRMYSRFRDAVNGFSKNVAEFFGGSHLVAIIFWLITTFGFIIVLMELPLYVFLLYLFLYFITRMAISFSGKQNVIKSILCILPLQISMGLFIVKSLTNRFYRNYKWKGREIKY